VTVDTVLHLWLKYKYLKFVNIDRRDTAIKERQINGAGPTVKLVRSLNFTFHDKDYVLSLNDSRVGEI
jgi:hypothetical protein